MSNSASLLTFESNPDRVRCLSGTQVYDEALLDGRLVTRYRNSNGQLWPEQYFTALHWNPDQPADAFHLAIDGRDLAGGWQWRNAELTPDPSPYRVRKGGEAVHGVVTLFHPEAEIEVKVHTRLDGGPFLVRWLEIVNRGGRAAGITGVAPFAGCLWTHRYEEHLPEGDDTPFEVAYNHMFEWGREGDFHYEPLSAGCKTVDGDKKGRSGWGRPAFWAHNRCNGQTFVCELAWNGNYRFDLDCRKTGANWGLNQNRPGQKNAELFFRMGLSGHDRVLRVIDPGETVTTPAVHAALFRENVDGIVQATHEHVRQTVMPEQLPGRHIEIEANHRGYLCDRENVPDILKDIDVAASCGVELYVIDAGWYGNAPNQWWNNAGDWFDGEWMKSGGGLKAVADHAHSRGLKFGLWIEIEAAGANSDLRKTHPDWLFRRDGKPVADGRALDFTNPEVIAFAEETVSRMIETCGLDLYRIDHNHCLTPSGNRECRGFTEDLIWRYYENFNALFARLRKRFPHVVFQNCAGGGGRLDWATMANFHNAELSDFMRLPRGFKILNGVTMSLPPEVLMRAFGTEAGEHALDGDTDTQLRHCFCRIILRGIAPSPETLSPYLEERIRHFIELYRTTIRPVMGDGRVFHHTPFLPLSEATPWCVLEYARKDASESVAVVMRTSGQAADVYAFRPRGIDPSRRYTVTLDSAGQAFAADGAALMRDGVPVRLEQPLTSELLIMRAE